jgi:DNA-binding beta-propeller fold protein YncE
MDPDQQSLWVLERCGDYNGPGCAESDLPAVMKFDASGRMLQSFGSGMFNYPHGLAVDHEGNVYVTDGRDGDGKGHTVLKFNPDGETWCGLRANRAWPAKDPTRSIGRPMSR